MVPGLVLLGGLHDSDVCMQGGDLRQALTQAPAQLHWYNKGASVALDIIKGLHFLHKHKVTAISRLAGFCAALHCRYTATCYR